MFCVNVSNTINKTNKQTAVVTVEAWFPTAASPSATDLGLAVGLAVVRGARGQDDDHDQQSPAGGQDGDQRRVVRGLLTGNTRRRLVALPGGA